MKKFWYAGPAALVAALAVASTSSALAPKKIPFTGSYSGQASTLVDGQTATISATGTGKGTLIGAGQIIGQGTGDASQQPCVPFAGAGKLTGTAGKTDHLQAQHGLRTAAVTRAARSSASPAMRRHQGDREAREGQGHAQVHGHLRPRDGTFSVKFTGHLTK